MDLTAQKKRFDSPEFEQEFHCDTPLGAFLSPEATEFRLWAPTAEQVTLRLYADGHSDSLLSTVSLRREDRGLWVWEQRENLDGTYYEYEVTVDGVGRVTADPYAKACGLNGKRSMVIDLGRTDPEGWQEDRAPEKTPETVIYELHVKDFSHDPAGGFAPEDRGRYSALCRTSTTLEGDGIHPTGVDYIKSLGVTHIQLMPVYDYGSVDEGGEDDQYNWGYDPVNYNVPEGSYSSDPRRGEVRIRELKQAVQALHRQGFRVIMDVVYNHTYELESFLWRTVPWYYYRQKEDGTPSNGSGCGNDLATERSMCAKYILDSVLYWTEEFHMDGFRFDLMGLLDTDLMGRIRAALDERYGAGEKLVYGEPWSAGESAVRPGTVLGHKGSLKAMGPHIGAFCDATRDAVKGSLMGLTDAGFVNGGGLSAEKLRRCITGWSDGNDSQVLAPSQTITYLSCHDDWTLWDKLVYTLDKEQRFLPLLPDIVRANRLAAAINLCCQGYPFLLAGEEFGRTKEGVKNSYRSAPKINRLDWTRAWGAASLVNYYRGLIALRMQLPALCDKSSAAAARVLSAADFAPNCAGITLNNGEGSRWGRLLLIFNGDRQPQRIHLPDGSWQVLADGESSFRWQEERTLSAETEVPSVSALILGLISQ